VTRQLALHPYARRSPLVALCAVGVLALTACGGDDDADTDTSEPAAAATTAANTESTTPATSGTNEIVISGFAFSGVTEVAVGTTVTVVNDDTATHTWSATDGTFDSGGIAPGESFEFTFEEAGSYDYRCNFHTSMTGTIVVTG